MEPLITRIDKAVQAHTDRIEAINRALHWLPNSSVRGIAISAGTSQAILDNRLGPKKTALSKGSLYLLGEHDLLNGPTSNAQVLDEHATEEERILVASSSAVCERFQLSNPTTFVGSEIIDLISIAANDLGDEPLRRTDVYEPSGFIYLEKPLVVKVPGAFYKDGVISRGEDDGETIGIRGISWMVDHRSVIPREKRPEDSMIISADESEIHVPVEGRGGIRLNVYTDLGCLRYITGITDWPDTMPDRTLILSQITAWAFDVEWRTIESGEEASNVDENGVLTCAGDLTVVRKFVLSLWRFMWQELVVRETGEVPRHVRKGMARALDRKDPITILKLRRHKNSADGTGDGSRLDYRLLVRGHWRNQWYRSLGPADDPASHRMIWIDPHVRGPEDAPFRTKPKVTAVVR